MRDFLASESAVDFLDCNPLPEAPKSGPNSSVPVFQEAPSLTTTQIFNGLVHSDFYWVSRQFTFSIPTATSTWPGYSAGSEPFTGYQAFSAAQSQRFVDAVHVWDSYIAPDIVQTDDVTATGNIRVGFSSYSSLSSVWGYAYAPTYHGSTPSPLNGDIWINATYQDATFAAGTYDWEALLHEIGHTLGLKHSFEAPVIPAPYENRRYTIMSYTDFSDDITIQFHLNTDASVGSNSSQIIATTPMVLDIEAIQLRYGSDPNTAAGDTVYNFGDNAIMQAIYDAGGSDTFDLSNLSRGSIVDLTPGAYSSINYWSVQDQTTYWKAQMPSWASSFVQTQFDKNAGNIYTWSNNLGIAYNTTIENCIGSSSVDTIRGNIADNVLTGGGGGDSLTGGDGADIFKDTRANMNGDSITDFSAGDTLNITDASLGSFSYNRFGTTLLFGSGKSLTLSNNPAGHLTISSDAVGGIDLKLGEHFAGQNDFNGDGHSDLLFRNVSSGAVTVWSMVGNGGFGLFSVQNTFATSVDAGWSIQGSFDFNGDNPSDLIWRNTTSGQFSIWVANGLSFTQNVYTDQVSTAYSMAGFGDFNGDGRDDIIWRGAGGLLTEWQSTGSGFTPNVFVNGGVDNAWHIQAIADFNGDSKADILWRNDSGTMTIWSSNGSGFDVNTSIIGGVNATWHVALTADFNGDGKDDILFRNDNGTFTEWQSTGADFTQNVFVNGGVDNSWRLQGAFDFNDDGKTDLLFRNDAGTLTIWESTGSGFQSNVWVDVSVANAFTIASHHYDIV